MTAQVTIALSVTRAGRARYPRQEITYARRYADARALC